MKLPVFHPQALANITMVPTGAERADQLAMQALEPKRVVIRSRPVNEADKFELEFEEPTFPLDPRAARAVGVDLHIGDTYELEDRLEISSREHLVHLGSVDSINKKYPADEGSTVTFEGRGYASFLLDHQWGSEHVDLGRPIDAIAEDVIDLLPGSQQMDVVVEGFDGVPDVPADTPKARRYMAKDGANLWEGMTEIARLVGALVTVRRDKVVIRPPRTVEAGSELPVFVAGQNISSLDVTREWGVQDIPNVKVTAIDPATRETVSGQHPRPFRAEVKISKSGGSTSKERDIDVKEFFFRIPNPTQTKLDGLAQQIWQRYEQQQLKVEIQTQDLRTWKLTADQVRSRRFEEAERDYEVPQIRNGSQVWIHIDREARSVLEKRTATRAQKARELRGRGYHPDVAETLSASWLQIRGSMFVTNAQHTVEEGEYSLQMKCKNAITLTPDSL